MEKHNIEAIILYTSNDFMFHQLCVSNLLMAGVKVHVITFSNMFRGEPENNELLARSNAQFSGNPMYRFTHLQWHQVEPFWFWEGFGRYVATQAASKETEYLLYIDIDEIIETDKFKAWIDTLQYKKYTAIKFGTYFYYQQPIYRMKGIDTYKTVMCKREYAQKLPCTADARLQYFTKKMIPRRLAKMGMSRNFLIYKKEVFIHHFCFVRTHHAAIFKKVDNSRHRVEGAPWVANLAKDFSHPLNDETILVKSKDIQVVDNIFNL